MIKELKDVKVSRELLDKLEEAIVKFLKKEFYLPLISELMPKDTLQNSVDDLIRAINNNRIVFNHGSFRGKFNAQVSRELKKLGAKFDRRTSTFKINLSDLPIDIRSAISISESRLIQKINIIDQRLSQIVPAEIADRLKIEHIFDATLYKMDKDISATLKGISVQPSLTDEGRALIAKDYTDTVKLSIKDWTQAETVKLRKKVQDSTFEGNRYEFMAKTIEQSYGVSQSKAKFIARQEANLLMAKFKEARYKDADVTEYKWRTVVGSANHPVRKMHKALDGQIFSFDDPPIVNEKGSRKNPGEDYGCRCTAVPIVRF